MPATMRAVPVKAEINVRPAAAAFAAGGPVGALHATISDRLTNIVWTIEERPIAKAPLYMRIPAIAYVALVLGGGTVVAALLR